MTTAGRGLSTDFANALAADAKSLLLIVKAEFDSGDVRLWSGIGNLTFGGEVYTGAAGVMQVNLPGETAAVRAAGGTIVLNGVDPAVLALADTEDYQGRPITVWLGARDSTGAVIPDPDPAFVGIMDVISPEASGASARVTVSVENRSALLDKAVERRLTPEDQHLDYPDDKAFDFVAGLAQRVIQWGPKA